MNAPVDTRASPADALSPHTHARAAAGAPRYVRAFARPRTGEHARAYHSTPTGGMYIFADIGVETSTTAQTPINPMYIGKTECTLGDLT